MNHFFRRVQSLMVLGISMCFSFFLKRKPKTPQRIAVVQMAKIGDIVCTTPLFRAIKHAHPTAQLFVFGNEINKVVLEGNPYIDEYVPLDRSLWKTVHLFRSKKIETLCITGPTFDILSAAVLARISCIVVPRIVSGWSPYVTLSYRILSTRVTVKDHHMGSYAPREYLRLIEPLGIFTEDTKKDIYFSDEAKHRVEEIFAKEVTHKDEFCIGILLGAGNEIKSWPPDMFAKLMNLIASQKRVRFILLGSEKDTDRADTIMKGISKEVSVTNLIGKLTMDELKACISRLSMVIGADTGPQYIAEALEIPTIDIVGPVDEREQPPIGTLHRIVKADRKKPELYVMNARVYNVVEAKRQVEAITPEMVFETFVELCAICRGDVRLG